MMQLVLILDIVDYILIQPLVYFMWHHIFLLYKRFMYSIKISLLIIHFQYQHSFLPHANTEFDNQMYEGTKYGTVLLVKNEKLLNQFSGCGENSVLMSSIIFDEYGYMAIKSIHCIFIFQMEPIQVVT